MKFLNDTGLSHLISKLKTMIAQKVDKTYVDNKFADITSESILLHQEYFISAENQEIFTLTKGIYKQNTSSIVWYLDGIKQSNKGVEEVSSTSIKIVGGVPAGSTVLIEYIEFANVQLIEVQGMSRAEIIAELGFEPTRFVTSQTEPDIRAGDEWHKVI